MIFGRTLRTVGLGGALVALLATSIPAAAQNESADTRIRRLEAEVRALQRKVFPGGDGRFFEPEITAQPSTTSTLTTPSTTAVTDILARLDALEAQVQRQTAQVEENTNTLRLLTERVALLEASPKPAVAESAPPPPPPSSAVSSNAERMGATSPAKPAAAVGPSSERLAAVQAIAKPQTDDAGDDEYSYGFRLWDAKFYPEAQQQLTMMVEKYPTHARISYARNLLGRAYLDDGKPKEAAPWFLKNYQADKNGARAGDSLLYLAEAMIALKDTKRACIALAEFSETYPALATGRLQTQYDADRAKVKCG
ncbi:tetratricopeptide repeat protein [Erythrobacter mangrovi]|uniref:Tetratricopeptide repeat protein n=1 Tax=Erythrobacter mangrovi TaxID=2739433 RepID=A0A7D4CNG6_9SPHN|nr:tetratricopeptide repeat protein [Erythrobacter mangrovi]QKG72048.1 hypothetical protein HQR01_12115 [Erythrobacter mangrovi]